MGKIELIARGVALRGSHRQQVLLCSPTDGSYAYLPGGHVEFGEDARAALVREMREETGLEVSVGCLLGVWEAAFVQDGKQRHEVNLMFHMEHAWPDEVPSMEPDIRFRWVDTGESGLSTGLRVYPGWLMDRLDDLQSGRVLHAAEGFPADAG